MMTLRTGKKRERRPSGDCKSGFTILEVLLALVITSGCLVSIVASLATLSRHLSRTEIEIQALTLANTKIMEWENLLRAGTEPAYFSESGVFQGAPEFSWRAKSTPVKIETSGEAALNSIHSVDSLHQLNIEIVCRNRPVVSLGAQGWLRAPTEIASVPEGGASQ